MPGRFRAGGPKWPLERWLDGRTLVAVQGAGFGPPPMDFYRKLGCKRGHRPRCGAESGLQGANLRKFGLILLMAAVLAGGFVLMALAGILVALVTDPFYPFLPFFAPLAVGVIFLAGWLIGRASVWLLATHPALRIWRGSGWAAAIILLGLWAWGVVDFFTTPMHWQ